MSSYVVRLALRRDTATPSDAVTGVIDLLVEKGLRNWVFRVDGADKQELVGYYDGFGAEVDIDKLTPPTPAAEAAPAGDEAPDDEAVDPPLDAPVENVVEKAEAPEQQFQDE